MQRLQQRLSPEHAIVAAVAAACVGLALPEGGFEATAFAAAGLIAWLAVVAGLAAGVFPRARPPRAAVAAGLCLGGFAVLTALSMAWASDDGRAFEDAVRALAYLGGFMLVLVASRRGGARPWLIGLAIGLVTVGAIALCARYVPELFGNPDADVGERLPAALGRLTYPIGYWNGLAAAMAAAVALLTWLGSSAGGARARALATAALPPVILALWATDSRAGLVAALIAVAVVAGFGPRGARALAGLAVGTAGGIGLIAIAAGREELFERPGTPGADEQGALMLGLTLAVAATTALARFALDRPIERVAVPRAAARAGLALAVLAALAAFVAADPAQRWEDFKAPPQGSELSEDGSDLLRSGGSGRYQFWETAVDAFGERPVAGVGAGDYEPYWLEHRELALIATRAHSLAFESLAELGLLGFALIAGFFAVAAGAAIRRRLAAQPAPELGAALAVLAVGAAAAAVDWTWDLPAVALPSLVAAALLAGPATLPRGPEPPAPGGGTAGSRRRFAGGVAVLLVAWVSICASGALLLAGHTLETSRERSAADDLEGAIDAANDAIDLAPWASEPRTQLALLLERAGDYPAAREALAEAIARDSRDFELHLLAARLAFEDGDAPAVEASTARARELNPLDAELRGSAP